MSTNPVQVQKYLRGVDYPCDKDDLVETARQEGANEEVLEALESMPEKKFTTPKDVSQAIGQVMA